MHHFLVGIRNFNTDGCFARDWRLNSDICNCQIQLDIIRQTDNTADFHTLIRLEFISGNCRTATDIGYLDTYTKTFKCLLKLQRSLFQGCGCLLIAAAFSLIKKIQWRKFVFFNLLFYNFKGFIRTGSCILYSSFRSCMMRRG